MYLAFDLSLDFFVWQFPFMAFWCLLWWANLSSLVTTWGAIPLSWCWAGLAPTWGIEICASDGGRFWNCQLASSHILPCQTILIWFFFEFYFLPLPLTWLFHHFSPIHQFSPSKTCQACGSLTDCQVVVREETSRRQCFELVGQKYEVPPKHGCYVILQRLIGRYLQLISHLSPQRIQQFCHLFTRAWVCDIFKQFGNHEFFSKKVHLWDGDPRVEDGLLSLKGLEKVTGGWWMEVHNGSFSDFVGQCCWILWIVVLDYFISCQISRVPRLMIICTLPTTTNKKLSLFCRRCWSPFSRASPCS